MAYLAKLRGLPRGSQAGDSSLIKGRGLRVNSGLGLAFDSGVKAALTPTANSVTFTAVAGGTWANAITVQTIVGALAIAVTFNATTGTPVIAVTAPATATLAANQAIVAAFNADPIAGQYVIASVAGTGAAANAAVGAAALSTGTTGTNVGTGRPLWLRVWQGAMVIVDLDSPLTSKVLRRSAGNYTVVGAGKYLDA